MVSICCTTDNAFQSAARVYCGACLCGPEGAAGDRYKRISLDPQLVDQMLIDVFLDSQREAPEQIMLDLDATDDPVHGSQEGRFFHGYYGSYCYLPLYIFCGEHLLCARLRKSNRDGAAGSLEELKRIVPRLREAWPETRILVRADSGFCRDWLMNWCEAEGVDYVLGVARNPRLEEKLSPYLGHAEDLVRITGEKTTLFTSFEWCTRETWSQSRLVIGKAEWSKRGGNPRFLVTSLRCESAEDAERIYRKVYLVGFAVFQRPGKIQRCRGERAGTMALENPAGRCCGHRADLASNRQMLASGHQEPRTASSPDNPSLDVRPRMPCL